MGNPKHVWPGAMWRPIPEDQSQPFIIPTQVIYHTAVDGDGTTSMFDWWNSQNLESHCYVQGTGGIEQYERCIVRADANNKANVRAISLETHDGWASTGNKGQVTRPWNQAQLNSMILFTAWACDEYNIPRRLCPSWDAPGIGYHKMFPEWSPSPTGCPGDVRAAQVRDIIIPALNYNPGPIPTTPPVPEDPHMYTVKNSQNLPITFRVENSQLIHSWRDGAGKRSGWYEVIPGTKVKALGQPLSANGAIWVPVTVASQYGDLLMTMIQPSVGATWTAVLSDDLDKLISK